MEVEVNQKLSEGLKVGDKFSLPVEKQTGLLGWGGGGGYCNCQCCTVLNHREKRSGCIL